MIMGEHNPNPNERTEAYAVGTLVKAWAAILAISVILYGIFLLKVEPVELRRALLLLFALTQAWLGVGYYMHLKFERPSLVYTVLLPLLLLVALIVFAVGEGVYVHDIRTLFYGG